VNIGDVRRVYVQLVRLSINSCSLYADCESCVSSEDHLLQCVWCPGRDECATASQCQSLYPYYDTHCPPVISGVSRLSCQHVTESVSQMSSPCRPCRPSTNTTFLASQRVVDVYPFSHFNTIHPREKQTDAGMDHLSQ